MGFVDYSSKKKVKIWEGVEGYLHHSDKATFAYLTLEEGAVVDLHHHPAEQWSHVLEGQLLFHIDGKEEVVGPGQCAYIPSNVPHSAKALSRCLVIDSFIPFRQDLVDLENAS